MIFIAGSRKVRPIICKLFRLNIMLNLLLVFNLLLRIAESACIHECTTPANPACPNSWIDGIPNGEETALPLVDSLFIECMERKCLHLYVPQDEECNIEG